MLIYRACNAPLSVLGLQEVRYDWRGAMGGFLGGVWIMEGSDWFWF